MLKNLSFVVKPVKDKATDEVAHNPLEKAFTARQYARAGEDVIVVARDAALITIATYFTFKTASYVIIFGAKRLFN